MRLRTGYWSINYGGGVGQVLYDMESTSVLFIGYDEDAETFSFTGRDVDPTPGATPGPRGASGQSDEAEPARNVDALFDQIVNSLTEVALP